MDDNVNMTRETLIIEGGRKLYFYEFGPAQKENEVEQD